VPTVKLNITQNYQSCRSEIADFSIRLLIVSFSVVVSCSCASSQAPLLHVLIVAGAPLKKVVPKVQVKK